MKKIFPLLVVTALLGCGSPNKTPRIAKGVVASRILFEPAMTPGVAGYRIPALVTAPNGDLIAAVDQRVDSYRDLNANRNINIVTRRSEDGGLNWSPIQTVADYPDGQSASDPSMIVDRETGDILLFYNFMDLDKAPGQYRLHVMKSADNGQTWSPAQDITEPITRPEWRSDFMFITSGRGVQTQSGMLLHTLVNLQHGLHVFGSQDHGQSWFVLDAAITPADESKIMELADGRWMVNSRHSGGLRWVHVSADSGRTWQSRPDTALVDPGCNASLIRYDAARLLFCNAGSAEARKNLTVRVSPDEGATWTEGKTLYAGGSAYSSLTVLKNGEIGVLFEKDDYAQMVFVRFTLDWLAGSRTHP